MLGRFLLRSHIQATTPRRRRASTVDVVAVALLLLAIGALATALWLMGARGG